MLFYLAQPSSLIILQKIQYHKKNAQFLLQLTHVADYDWWGKKKKVMGPCESNRQLIKV